MRWFMWVVGGLAILSLVAAGLGHVLLYSMYSDVFSAAGRCFGDCAVQAAARSTSATELLRVSGLLAILAGVLALGHSAATRAFTWTAALGTVLGILLLVTVLAKGSLLAIPDFMVDFGNATPANIVILLMLVLGTLLYALQSPNSLRWYIGGLALLAALAAGYGEVVLHSPGSVPWIWMCTPFSCASYGFQFYGPVLLIASAALAVLVSLLALGHSVAKQSGGWSALLGLLLGILVVAMLIPFPLLFILELAYAVPWAVALVFSLAVVPLLYAVLARDWDPMPAVAPAVARALAVFDPHNIPPDVELALRLFKSDIAALPIEGSHDLAEKAFADRLSDYNYNAAYVSAAKRLGYERLGMNP